MRKLAIVAGAAALGLSSQAFGYSATGNVTFSWGGNGGGLANAGSAYGATADSTADIAWTSNGTSSLSAMGNSVYFTQLSGYNSRSYYNPDFTQTGAPTGVGPSCVPGAGIVPNAVNQATVSRRKYGCRYSTYPGNTPTFKESAVTDAAAPLTGARASGSITVTDTTLTGTLTIVSTTDEPSNLNLGISISPTGARISNAGQGTNGYNYRSADGSPFGNYWQGITTTGTLTLNLTGTFTSGAWNINGGTVAFIDPNFACQQGGLGDTGDALAGTLCTGSQTAGGQQNNGQNLSWGWDIDGAGTGNTAITGVTVVGAGPPLSLSGVLASLSVSGGNLTTVSGEYRRGLGSAGGGCANYLVYSPSQQRITCGTLTTGLLDISGSVTEAVVPVPAAVWLMGSALGLLGWIRRKSAA